MAEFTLAAFARYPDDSTGDAVAEVVGPDIAACFAAVSAALMRWMPPEIHRSGDEVPEAVELTLSWGGDAPSAAHRATRPVGPSEGGEVRVRSEHGGEPMLCAIAPPDALHGAGGSPPFPQLDTERRSDATDSRGAHCRGEQARCRPGEGRGGRAGAPAAGRRRSRRR